MSWRPPLQGPRGRLFVAGSPEPGIAPHACRFVLAPDVNQALDEFHRANPDLPADKAPWIRPLSCVFMTVTPGLTRDVPPGIYEGISSVEDVGTHYEFSSEMLRVGLYFRRFGDAP